MGSEAMNRLDSYEQWHCGRIGSEVRLSGGTQAQLVERVHGVYDEPFRADAMRFALAAFNGEPVPELDGPHPDAAASNAEQRIAASQVDPLYLRTMKITAIFWQPNERLLTVRTAIGDNSQIGGVLSDEELVAVLGPELTRRICELECRAPELSDLVVHALRGEDLGYLATDYAKGTVCVVPVRVTPEGNVVPDNLDREEDYDGRPSFRL